MPDFVVTPMCSISGPLRIWPSSALLNTQVLVFGGVEGVVWNATRRRNELAVGPGLDRVPVGVVVDTAAVEVDLNLIPS